MASVNDLKSHFETKINRTFLAYDLRNCNDSADRETLRGIELDIRHMEKAIVELRKVISNGKLELAEVQAHTRDVRAMADEARHVAENVPEALLRAQTDNRRVQSDGDDGPKVLNENAVSHHHGVGHNNNGSIENLKENKAPSSNSAPSKPSNVPLMSPLTPEEYADTPKYMLGRITHASLNKTVQDINLTMAEKYRLMKKKQKDKTPQEVRLVQTFKKQENAESQGSFFILGDDLKLLGVSTDGFNARQFASHLPILRHHHRLREIRGGGFTRLAIC